MLGRELRPLCCALAAIKERINNKVLTNVFHLFQRPHCRYPSADGNVRL